MITTDLSASHFEVNMLISANVRAGGSNTLRENVKVNELDMEVILFILHVLHLPVQISCVIVV